MLLYYINEYKDEHLDFINAIESYFGDEPILDHKNLLGTAQVIISSSFTRAKRECGITYKMDADMNLSMEEEMQVAPKRKNNLMERRKSL